jgi:hypothetical protein
MKKVTLFTSIAAVAITGAAAPNVFKVDLWEHVKDNPELREDYLAKKAGSLQKYLEMDKTPGRRIVWKYFEMKQTDPGSNIHLRIAADKIVTVLRKAKNGRDDEKGHVNVRVGAINDVPALLKKGKATAEESEAFTVEAARAKAEWLKAWNPGYVEKSAAEVASAAGSAKEKERQASIERSNYLLGDLSDQDRSKANVAKRKAKFDEALQKAHSPDRILGTYSTSRFWQGIPVFKDEALKEKWSSLQEMTYKSFYQKGGRYFVVTGGFRQGITHEDAKRGKSASEVADYWPGLESPVEVPAELIEKHFK